MSAQAFLLLSLAVSAAPPSPARTEPLSGRALYNQAVRATVYVENKPKRSSGTGWIVDKQRRLIVTNYHVAPEGECILYFPRFENGKVVSDGRKYFLTGVAGKVIDSDPKIDLSVIEVSS